MKVVSMLFCICLLIIHSESRASCGISTTNDPCFTAVYPVEVSDNDLYQGALVMAILSSSTWYFSKQKTNTPSLSQFKTLGYKVTLAPIKQEPTLGLQLQVSYQF